MLHGFFGDDWATGIGPLHEQERRNYLFAAKSGGWASVKKEYDVGAGGVAGATESVPFLRPLQGVVSQEIEAAEKSWSEWLAMEDWMVGPRAPVGMDAAASSRSRGHSIHHQQHYQDSAHHQQHHDSSGSSRRNENHHSRTGGEGPHGIENSHRDGHFGLDGEFGGRMNR